MYRGVLKLEAQAVAKQTRGGSMDYSQKGIRTLIALMKAPLYQIRNRKILVQLVILE